MNSHTPQITTLAALVRLNLLEVWRGRSVRFALLSLIAIECIVAFATQMAITESTELKIATSAYLYRLVLVFALGVSMISSVVREFESGFIYVLLSHPITRLHYVLGRILGFAALALIATVCVSTVLVFKVDSANYGALALWALSLWLELLVVGAVALFCAMGLKSMVASLGVWLAFYVLARVLDVARVMAASPVGQSPESLSAQLGQWTFGLISWVVPPLGTYTRAEWLLGLGTPSAALCMVLGVWALVYALVCAFAAAIDFYRHEV